MSTLVLGSIHSAENLSGKYTAIGNFSCMNAETNSVAVAQLLQRFNDTVGQWIGYLDDYTLEMLQQPPRTGSWSLGQVYIHIINDTRYFVQQMKESLKSPADDDKEMHPAAKTMLRNNAFPDRMIEGPATHTPIPQPDSKERLSKGLVSIRDAVNDLFADANVAGSNVAEVNVAEVNVAAATGKTAHPGLGYFTSLEWLQFAEMHMRHHFRQKKRIDEQLYLTRP